MEKRKRKRKREEYGGERVSSVVQTSPLDPPSRYRGALPWDWRGLALPRAVLTLDAVHRRRNLATLYELRTGAASSCEVTYVGRRRRRSFYTARVKSYWPDLCAQACFGLFSRRSPGPAERRPQRDEGRVWTHSGGSRRAAEETESGVEGTATGEER